MESASSEESGGENATHRKIKHHFPFPPPQRGGGGREREENGRLSRTSRSLDAWVIFPTASPYAKSVPKPSQVDYLLL